MEELFRDFWWLIFPIFGMVDGLSRGASDSERRSRQRHRSDQDLHRPGQGAAAGIAALAAKGLDEADDDSPRAATASGNRHADLLPVRRARRGLRRRLCLRARGKTGPWCSSPSPWPWRDGARARLMLLLWRQVAPMEAAEEARLIALARAATCARSARLVDAHQCACAASCAGLPACRRRRRSGARSVRAHLGSARPLRWRLAACGAFVCGVAFQYWRRVRRSHARRQLRESAYADLEDTTSEPHARAAQAPCACAAPWTIFPTISARRWRSVSARTSPTRKPPRY